MDDAALDNAWQVWEDAFAAALLSNHPKLAPLLANDHNAHLAAAAELVERLADDGIELQLPIGSADDVPASDPESVQRLIGSASITLRTPPWTAVTATIGDGVAAGDVVELVAGTTQPKPWLVISGATSRGLLSDQVFPPADRRHLEGLRPGPVFAVRGRIDHGGVDTIFHGLVPDPATYNTVTDLWGNRGPIANCVAASCFVDAGWQQRWLPTLTKRPTVVLVDCGLVGMTGPGRLLGTSEHIWGAYLDISHPSLKALVWHVDTHPHVMLIIADDLTTQLIAGQLTDLTGERLHLHDSDWTQWQEVLAAVAASVLRTQSSLRFDGVLLR